MSFGGKNSAPGRNGAQGGGSGVPGLRSRRMALHRQPKKRVKGDIRSEINVTPLVDVVLVLLIIFMVVTPMLSRGVAVDLPLSRHHDKKNDDGKDIIVSITKDGLIYVDKDQVVLEKVKDRVEEEKRRFPDKVILLKGDARGKYGKAREVMEAIHKAGFDDVQLGTEEPKDRK